MIAAALEGVFAAIAALGVEIAAAVQGEMGFIEAGFLGLQIEVAEAVPAATLAGGAADGTAGAAIGAEAGGAAGGTAGAAAGGEAGAVAGAEAAQNEIVQFTRNFRPEPGVPGPQGEPGQPGKQGEPGADGQDGLDGKDAQMEYSLIDVDVFDSCRTNSQKHFGAIALQDQ